MKTIVWSTRITATLLVLVAVFGQQIAQGQTVNDRAPIIAAGFVTSSSTLPNGGYIRSSTPIARLASNETYTVTAGSVPETTISASDTISYRPMTETSTVSLSASPSMTTVVNSNETVGAGTVVTNNASWQSTTPASFTSAQANPCVNYTPTSATTVMSVPPPPTTQVMPANTVPTLTTQVAPTAVVASTPVSAPALTTYKPLIPLRRSVPAGTYVSQALWGQPKAYVQGQGVRNFFRYILP